MERRAFPGGISALVSSELERRGFLAAFTERTGGASEPPYASLNLGSEVGDHPAVVEENRRRLAAALGVGSLAVIRQVHGTAIRRVSAQRDTPTVAADALVTSLRSVPLAVMAADCVPLALASEPEGKVAAIHVGWRGLAAGLVQRATELFREPREVVAAIGPAIGPCHYEVGPEVVHAVRGGVGQAAVVKRAGERHALDLGATVETVLEARGTGIVERAGTCTACDASRFFSHRRDGTTGRQALVAVRL